MKFCKDCKYSVPVGPLSEQWECNSPDVNKAQMETSAQYRVTGKIIRPECGMTRVLGAACGPEAKFWEAKE